MLTSPAYKLSEWFKIGREQNLAEGKNMPPTAETAFKSSQENSENPQSETQSLQEFARDWKPGILTGRKKYRRIADDYSEIFIEKTGDWHDTNAEYQVKYREGRLGPSDKLKYGEFDKLGEAVEYTELITEEKAELEEIIPE